MAEEQTFGLDDDLASFKREEWSWRKRKLK